MLLAALLAFLTSSATASPSSDALAAVKAKDYATAFRLWEGCAKKGTASCQYDLAIMYLEGEGRPVDVGAALDWLSRSAGQNYPGAENRLGRLYLNGKVVTQDYPAAMRYFMAAARQGYAAGQANVGLMHWRGYGVPVNLVEAFAWSELSTVKLTSGAKQRDDILKELTPEQWTQGRARAEALKKEYASFKIPWEKAFDFIFGILSIVASYFIIRNYVREAKRKKALGR